MQTDRRRVMAGLAGLGLAGAGTGAAAAAPAQIVAVGPADAMLAGPGVFGGDYTVTVLDRVCGQEDEVAFVLTSGALAQGGVNVDLLYDKLYAWVEAGKDARLRHLHTRQGWHSLMAVYETGGRPGAANWYPDQTEEEFADTLDGIGRMELEPATISVQSRRGLFRFTTVFRKASGPWEVRRGLGEAELAPLVEAMRAKGLRLARALPYLKDGEVRFVTLFLPAGPHDWTWSLGETGPDAAPDDPQASGFALLQAAPWDVGDKRRWCCIWQKAVGAPQDYFWGN